MTSSLWAAAGEQTEMGNICSITSLKILPMDALFSRRTQFTARRTSGLMFPSLPSHFHFNTHFNACKRLQLLFHYRPINSTISGSVTSIWRTSKTSPQSGRSSEQPASVWAGPNSAFIATDWSIVISIRWCPGPLCLSGVQRVESEACRLSEERKGSTLFYVSSGFLPGHIRGACVQLFDEVSGRNGKMESSFLQLFFLNLF